MEAPMEWSFNILGWDIRIENHYKKGIQPEKTAGPFLIICAPKLEGQGLPNNLDGRSVSLAHELGHAVHNYLERFEVA
jgi:hypothetical protein